MDKQHYISYALGLPLYKPNEYPVIVGNIQKSIALCTVWQDAQNAVDRLPELKKEFAIIGNLRSAFGINIMLYNLALNPGIKCVVIWGMDRLSQTSIGSTGKKTLLSLWENGLNKDRQIIKTSFRLVEEINPVIVNKIIKSVALVDQSEQKTLLVNTLPKISSIPYMEKIIFPQIIVKTNDPFPSEKYTYTIREKKGADAYLSLLYTILRYGKKAQIDTGGEEVQEINGALVVVEDETESKISLPKWLTKAKFLGINKKSLENYYESQFSDKLYTKELFKDVFLFEKPKDYSYLYAQLMYALPRLTAIDDALYRIFDNGGYEKAKEYLFENCEIKKSKAKALIKKIELKIGDNKKRLEILLEALIPAVNQIDYVIERIKRKPMDLDKEVVLWDIRRDKKLESGRPCLNKLSFSVRNGKINVHVFARSHDIGRAWFFNFYGILKLLHKICKKTNYKPGFIILESESAHIYQRDYKPIQNLIEQEMQNKTPRMYFDPYLDSDPRGIINISVSDGKIKLKLQDTESGKLLFEFEVETAREGIYKLKHYKFISRPDHAAFIGTELAKAEVCIKLGVEYKYDQPINFSL